MDARVPRPLPKHILFEVLDALTRPEPMGLTPPTPRSVQVIEAELGIRVPDLFVEIAARWSSFVGYFASLDENFEDHTHILQRNRRYRDWGLPARYVVLNHGYDGYFDAWDLAGERAPGGELPIVWFSFEFDEPSGGGRFESPPLLMASSAEEYFDRFVRAQIRSHPKRNLRKRLKRLLQACDDSADGTPSPTN